MVDLRSPLIGYWTTIHNWTQLWIENWETPFSKSRVEFICWDVLPLLDTTRFPHALSSTHTPSSILHLCRHCRPGWEISLIPRPSLSPVVACCKSWIRMRPGAMAHLCKGGGLYNELFCMLLHSSAEFVGGKVVYILKILPPQKWAETRYNW